MIDEDPISSLLHHGSVEIKELCDVTRHSMVELAGRTATGWRAAA